MTHLTLPHDGRSRELGPTIVGWFDRIAAGQIHWDKEGLVHDLILMATSCVWTGHRRSRPGGTLFTKPKIMDRLEVLQRQYPSLTFFVGTLPNPSGKGQDRTQILWYSDTEMGAEGDLEARQE
jgi:hypothetical protein